jgi:hypothetical protein
MYRIISGRGTGKTNQLMLLAKESGATIVCSNPRAMQQKAHAYGLTGMDYISYGVFAPDAVGGDNKTYLVDELEEYLGFLLGSMRIATSTMSVE